MAEGKWITGLTADTPVQDAARRALMVRFDVVRHYLPLAVGEAEKDSENVHQLRVGTRRAGAALDIFQSCLDEKAFKVARKALRRIRRAAGAARDWDVFLLDITSYRARLPAKQQHGLDFLFGLAVAHRQQAQEQLRDTSPAPHFEFDRVLAQTIAAVHKPQDSTTGKTLGDLAVPMLAGLLRELEGAVARDLDSYENLHQVRIVGKRLRYAMEVFGDCFHTGFRETHYKAVEGMQEILGRANDSHVAGQRLSDIHGQLADQWSKEARRYGPGIDGFRKHHQEQLPKHKQQFLEWWQTWQQSGGEQHLAQFLVSSEKKED